MNAEEKLNSLIAEYRLLKTEEEKKALMKNATYFIRDISGRT